jgi:ABC-2 type transport system ATP-binding protein
MMVSLELRNVYKKTKDSILNNVNVFLYPNEKFGFLAKQSLSLLMDVLAGKTDIDSGYIFLDGSHLDRQDLIRHVGYAVKGNSFYEELDIRENLAFFGRLYGIDKKAIKNNTKKLVEIFELKKLGDSLDRKKLEICCSLMHNPDILLLDDPFYNLSKKDSKKLLHYLAKLSKIIVIGSDNLDNIEHFCNRLAIMQQGRIIAQGTSEQLRWFYAKNEELYLETYPGDYNLIIRELIKKRVPIQNWKIIGHRLVLFSKKSETLVHHILHVLDEYNEKLVELEIRKPGLTEVLE